jgi:glycosyltransferase involved in cell wall biosynthesis
MHIVMLQFYSSTPAPDMHEMAAALREWGHSVEVGTPDVHGDLVVADGTTEVGRIPGPEAVPSWTRRVGVLAKIAERVVQIGFILRVRAFLGRIHPDIVQVNPPAYAFLLPLFRRRKSAYVLDVRQPGAVKTETLIGRIKNWRSVMTLRINAMMFYDHSCYAAEPAAEYILGPRWARWGSIHRVGQNPAFLAHQWPTEEPALKTGPVRFVYIGTISRVRQLELLLAAIRETGKVRTDFHVDFIGPDEEGGFYHDLIRDWKLEPLVTMKHALPYARVAAAVAAYDVALAYVPPLPDWRYQPTLKVLEYRALGVPSIVSDNAPNRQVIEEGVNGIFVQHTQASITGALLKCVTDRDFLRRITIGARRLRSGRTWAESAREYVDLVYVPLLARIRTELPR